MTILLGILGLLVLALTSIDLLWTTFVEGVGPMSLRVALLVGRVLRFSVIRRKTRRVMAWGGLLVVMVSLATWTILLWTGWTLIFCSWPTAVVAAATGKPADAWQRAYFTGYNLFTLGMGDFVPRGAFFQILTDLCCASGFFLFGAAIAYLVPVISAATQKRQVGVYIWSLGKNPAEIIFRAWNGADTTALQPHFIALTPMLLGLGENHLTYPVLHFFHSSKRSAGVGANIAMLDEAITVMECGLAKGCSLDLPSLGAVREAISEYILTLKPVLQFVYDEGYPPVPSLAALREVGLPVVDDATFAAALANQTERRLLLRKLARIEGWAWESVWPQQIDLTRGI
jgi:hypothetical protein